MSAGKSSAGKVFAASIPYAAVGVGVYGLRSAWAAVLMYHLGIVLLIAVNRRWDIVRSFRAGWDLRWGIAAVIISSLTGVIIYLAWPFAKLPPVELSEVMERFSVIGSAGVVFAVYAIFVNPILEEMLWRGYLFDDRKGICWVDIAFAGYHVLVLPLVINPLLCVGAFFALVMAGWMFRLLRRRLGGLGTVWLMHLTADISIIIAVYFLL
ncbi:MAG: CPBP family intramembrane metalloprotease [Anaerohalosphaera sp.]|nr:CPBP family intramembrane metalloprotease [Anaerohalosphaera sp.]